MKLKTFLIIFAASLIFTGEVYCESTIKPSAVTLPAATQQAAQYQYANALDVVAVPARYLNKNITIRAKFDKFSTLGLDYTPAMRSSETYISFLIQRDDIKDHSIPLSEMKIFMKRTEAEKYIDLNSGDEIEFSGKVFSNALGDVWIDAYKFTVLNKKEQPKK